MKYVKICLCVLAMAGMASCGNTPQQDNTTGSKDTMVIKKDKTDSATTTVTTDTTKR